MALLRDIPEGFRIVDDGAPQAPVEAVEWLDGDGGQVRILFQDGSVRNGDGSQELSLSTDTATPFASLAWGPKRWDERVDEAWLAYVNSDEQEALDDLIGIDEVEFTGDYNIWTFVESGLVLQALILTRQGNAQQAYALKAKLNVEDRAAHPKIAHKVLLRRFTEELPDDPNQKLRESARRWARSGSLGIDGTSLLQAHDAVLAELRTAPPP